MRKAIALTVMAMGVAAVLASSTAAADSVVGATNCLLVNGGQVTRPAGSTIVVRNGFATKNYGIDVNFLNAQTTTLSVNGGPAVDISGSYGAPTQVSDGSWRSDAFYATGVTLANPGDTMTFTISVSVSHRVADVQSEPGQPLFGGPGVIFSGTCTVTAT
jgi:hypothetical protein